MSFELIETVELTASAASIEFTSIPQDGTDLVLLLSIRSTTAGADFYAGSFRLNGNPATSSVRLSGDGSTAISNTGDDVPINAPDTTANTFTNHSFYISNYTSSTAKSVSNDFVAENNATASRQQIIASVFDFAEPVTSITFLGGGNYAVGTTASLYKITAA